MAETIPGGYYIGADGKPHDANGNPIQETKPAKAGKESEKDKQPVEGDKKPAEGDKS